MVHIEHDSRLGFSASLAALNGRSAISFREQRDDHSAPHQLVLRAVDPGGNFLGAPVVLADSHDARLTYLGTSGIGEGAFIAIWAAQEVDSTGAWTSSRLMSRVFGQDGAFLGPSLAIVEERGSGGDLFEGCDVAALADGGVVIVWPRYDGILAHRIGPDGTPRGASIEINRVEAVDQSEQSDPHVAALSNGGFVVVWTDADHIPGRDGYVVLARQFDADGNAVGEATRVNRTVLPDPIIPHVTQLDGGRFVISWTTSSPPNDSVETGLLLNDIIAPQLMPSERITAFHDGSAGAVVAFRLPDSDAITRIVSLGSVAITTPIPSSRQVDINLSWQIMGSMILVPVASLAALWAQDAQAREIEISAESGGLRFVERISLDLMMGADFETGTAALSSRNADSPASTGQAPIAHRGPLVIDPADGVDTGEATGSGDADHPLDSAALSLLQVAVPDLAEAPAVDPGGAAMALATERVDKPEVPSAPSSSDAPGEGAPTPEVIVGSTDDDPVPILVGSGPGTGTGGRPDGGGGVSADPIVVLPPNDDPGAPDIEAEDIETNLDSNDVMPNPPPLDDDSPSTADPEGEPDTLDPAWIWIDFGGDGDEVAIGDPEPITSPAVLDLPIRLSNPLSPDVAVDLPSHPIDTLIWLI